jgi:ATP-dependent helicase/nuclease subunit A
MSPCRNIRFIASAGTGKTHQVVSLYQALLFGRPYPSNDQALPGVKAGSIFDGASRLPPDRILMLTFTKNAAAEMRSRVTEAIEHELATGNPETEAFCWSLLRQLSNATLSTIHSFAQQLLSSNTLLLGLSPDLTILEESEAEDLRTDIITAVLKTALTSADAAYAGDVECLCDGRGFPGMEEGLVRVLRLGAAWGLDIEHSDPSSLVEPPAAPTLAALQLLVKPIEQAAAARPGKTIKTMAAELSETIRRLGAAPSSEAIAKAAGELRKLTTTSWGTDEGIKQLRKEAQKNLDTLAAYPDRVHATRLLIAFLTLARDCARQIQAHKRAQGVLDFDDLLFTTRDLIRARPTCVPGFEVIIVDEAQDNSRLQNELIRLVQEASGASMVMCGDTKQTIYGWRGADAEGLSRFAETLHLDAVPLRTSYRSQKGILDWINDIFAGVVLGVDRYGENETLSPCPRAKALEGPSVELLIPEWEWGPKPDDSIPTGKKEPKLRLTLTPKDVRALAVSHPGNPDWEAAAEQTEQAIAMEARAVARRIRLLTTPDAGTPWHPAQVWNAARGEWIAAPAKPYQFRDILILLRASTRQELYEQALQEEGIPFTTDGKGRGFFARQETLDVANLLSWLAFPNDRLAFLGLLRSPFVALSDNAVATLGANLQDLKFEISNPFLSRLRALAGRISAVDLVREAIRLTGYDAILAGTFHGVQRLANLQKLLSWIQARERDETLNLQETARRLAGEITRGREAPDAAVLDPDDDSVRINTVHAAKGLSSPVVILPDLRRLPQSDRDWVLITRDETGDARGVAGKVKVYADDDAGDLESALYSAAAEGNKEARDQESRRLFYVACTRARDLLILSGENPGNGSQDAWRSWINQHLIQRNFDTALLRVRPYGEVEKAWRKIATPTLDRKIPTPRDFMAVGAGKPAMPTRECYRYPVTALIHSNPDALSRLSLASLTVAPTGRNEGEASEPVLDRSEQGTLAHRILETLNYASPVPLATQIEQSPDWGDASAAEREKVRPQIKNAAQLLSLELAEVPTGNIIRELPFAARFTHDSADLIVDGKVDLLFLKNGIWHILDYKFSDLDVDRLKARYALQLAVYRDALSAPTDDPALRTPRFDTTETRAAPFTLILLGINGRGDAVKQEIDGEAAKNVSARLMAAARALSVH